MAVKLYDDAKERGKVENSNVVINIKLNKMRNKMKNGFAVGVFLTKKNNHNFRTFLSIDIVTT